jgi:hypothetical protein
MDCTQTRDWLLQAEDPRPERCSSPEAAEHLLGCAACRSFAAELVQLEQNWRAIPLPGAAEALRDNFLKNLPTPAVVAKPQAAGRKLADRLVRWAVAALVVLGVGLAVWTLSPTNRAVASPVLIEKLVDWNLELAQAETPAERAQIYTKQEAAFKKAVEKSKLSAEERELADLLLDNSTFLATNDDPMAEAERLSTVSDKLVEQLQSAAAGKDQAAVDRYAKLQGKVNKRGLNARLAKLQESPALDFEHERQLEKIVLRDSKRMNLLADLLERNPDMSRKEIREALGLTNKNAKTVSGISFELDAKDKIGLGEPAQYRIKLHNHNAAAAAKLQVVVTVPEGMELMSAHGPTLHRQEGRQVIFRPLSTLPANGEATFDVKVKPTREGEAKCRAELRAKQMGYKPLMREQTTTVQSDPQ